MRPDEHPHTLTMVMRTPPSGNTLRTPSKCGNPRKPQDNSGEPGSRVLRPWPGDAFSNGMYSASANHRSAARPTCCAASPNAAPGSHAATPSPPKKMNTATTQSSPLVIRTRTQFDVFGKRRGGEVVVIVSCPADVAPRLCGWPSSCASP